MDSADLKAIKVRLKDQTEWWNRVGGGQNEGAAYVLVTQDVPALIAEVERQWSARLKFERGIFEALDAANAIAEAHL